MAVTSYAIPTSSPYPYGMCLGPDGRIWFCETLATSASGKIGAIDTSGAITEYTIGGDTEPKQICVGPDNNLWFTESKTNRVSCMNTSGAILHQYSTPTGGSSPEGICVGPDNYIWFTENLKAIVGKLDTTTGSITEYALPTDHGTWQPFGICRGPAADGRLWFCGLALNYIGAITTSGTVTEYPVTPSATNIANICCGADGALYFAEYGGSGIGRITTDGTYTRRSLFSGLVPYNPVFITTGLDGTIWMTEEVGDQISYMTTSGASTAITRFSPGDSYGGETGIAFGADKNIWYCSGFAEWPAVVSSAITKLPVDYTHYASPATCPIKTSGFLAFSSGQTTWANVKAATANVFINLAYNPPINPIELTTYTVSGDYTLLSRGQLVFDTSYIPPNANITSAVLSVYVSAKQNATGMTNSEAGIAVTGVDMLTTTALYASDWLKLGSSRYATDVGYSSVNTGAYNQFALNSTGRAAIGKGLRGVFQVALSFACDADNVAPASWAYNNVSSYTIDYATNLPQLVVTYSSGTYSITAEADITLAPKEWRLYGSNDESNWTLIDSQTNMIFTASEQKTFYVVPTRYAYYRLYVDKDCNGYGHGTHKIAALDINIT